MTSRRLLLLLVAGASAAAIGMGPPAAADSMPRVAFRPGVIDLFNRASITVSGLAASSIEVRLRGATDAAGLAYEWTSYRWRRLRLSRGAWRGALPAPALPGIYQLELRRDGRRGVVQSRNWLLRVFPRGTVTRPSFSTPVAVVRDFVRRLPGNQVMAALRRFQPAAFDRRDIRLHRVFVVAYAPRGDTRLSSRLGLFITTFRDGFHGRWRLLAATTEPYG